MDDPQSEVNEQELLRRAEQALRVPEPRQTARQRFGALFCIAAPVPLSIAFLTLDLLAGLTIPPLGWWLLLTPIELLALYMVVNYSGLLRLHILRAHLRSFVRHRRLKSGAEDTARTLAGLVKSDEYTRECLWLSLLLCAVGALGISILSDAGIRLKLLFVTSFLIPALQSFTYARLHAIYIIYNSESTLAIWHS